jgi:uncharacterized membrane protein YgcG
MAPAAAARAAAVAARAAAAAARLAASTDESQRAAAQRYIASRLQAARQASFIALVRTVTNVTTLAKAVVVWHLQLCLPVAWNKSVSLLIIRILTMRTLVAVVFAAALGFALTAAAGPTPPSHSGGHTTSTGSKSTGSGEHVSRGGEHVSRGGKSGSR